MACFSAPLVESVVVKAIESHEAKKEAALAAREGNAVHETAGTPEAVIPLSRKLRWLTWLLWGGSALLLFEHIWHGEIVPWFPFLTAMASPEDAAEMFHEIATAGVAMSVLITAVWFAMCKVADAIVKRPAPQAEGHAA